MQARENRTARATILRHLSRNYNVLFARESPPLSIFRSYLAEEKMATEQAVYYRLLALFAETVIFTIELSRKANVETQTMIHGVNLYCKPNVDYRTQNVSLFIRILLYRNTLTMCDLYE